MFSFHKIRKDKNGTKFRKYYCFDDGDVCQTYFNRTFTGYIFSFPKWRKILFSSHARTCTSYFSSPSHYIKFPHQRNENLLYKNPPRTLKCFLMYFHLATNKIFSDVNSITVQLYVRRFLNLRLIRFASSDEILGTEILRDTFFSTSSASSKLFENGW